MRYLKITTTTGEVFRVGAEPDSTISVVSQGRSARAWEPMPWSFAGKYVGSLADVVALQLVDEDPPRT